MTTQPNHKQRIAVRRLFTPHGVISPAVVELEEGRIVAYSKLESELPFTYWRGGDIHLEQPSTDKPKQ